MDDHHTIVFFQYALIAIGFLGLFILSVSLFILDALGSIRKDMSKLSDTLGYLYVEVRKISERP